MNLLEQDIKKLESSFDQLTKFSIAVGDLIVELVELNNSEVDKLLDKYGIGVEGKYPRGVK